MTSVDNYPAFLDEYVENAREYNRLKKRQEELKPIVLNEINKGIYSEFYIQEQTRTEYSHDLIYEWICKTYPQKIIDFVTKRTLDWEKFISAVNLQDIDFLAMPEYCEVKNKIFIAKKRKKKK